MTISREIRLKSRPVGVPKVSDFDLATVELAGPGDGEIQVKNLWMSVDPYMRGRMYDRPSYVPPFQIGQALQGLADLERRHIAGTIVHAAAHIGIDRHPEVLHLDLAVARPGQLDRGQVEVGNLGHAHGTALQADFARDGHGRSSLAHGQCC